MYDIKMYHKNSIFLCNEKALNDIAVVFITTEGIQHLAGGVGHYIRNFIITLGNYRHKLTEKGINLTIYAGEPAISRVLPSYSTQNLKDMLSIIESTGGEFFKLINNTQGENWIGNIENWKIMSASAAGIVLNIARKHQATLLFTGSTCFAMLPVYIHKQIRVFKDADIRSVFLTHDSAFSTFYSMINEDILTMDYLTCQWCDFTPNAKIGYVSSYMKELFKEKYHVKENAFVSASSGVLVSNPRYNNITEQECRELLMEYNIPIDKKLIVSWGRAEGYKRFDVVFSASKLLDNDFFTVVVTNTQFPEMRRYVEKINCNGCLIESYKGFDLIKALISCENTMAVVFMSDNEPGSMAPLEAMLLLKEKNALVIANNSGMYREIIEDEKNGFLITNEANILAKKISMVNCLSAQRKKEISIAAYETVISKYTQEKNYIDTLMGAVSQLKHQI